MADIREILGRIRPNAEWGWKGGNPTDISQLRWRDAIQSKPTQTEIDAEQIVVNTENSVREASKSNRNGRGISVVGGHGASLNPAQVAAIIEQILDRLGALDDDGKIKPLSEW